MAEYHVGCGCFGIYAGTMNKVGDMWKSKAEVTEEAIAAVRDYMCLELLGNNIGECGYAWDTSDGREIALRIEITDKKCGANNNEQ